MPAPAPPEGKQLTLEEAYQLALARSEVLKLAWADVERADVERLRAWTLLGPTAIVTAQGVLQQRIAIPDGLGGSRETQLPLQAGGSATIVQPVFRRGFFPARRAGIEGLDQAKATAERTREQLRVEVVSVFLQTLKARRLVEVARSNRERTEAQLKAATGRFASGASLRTAVIQAQIDVYRADRQVADAEASVGFAAAAFERLVGIHPPELASPPEVVAPALQEALRRASERNDLRALRAGAAQSRARVGIAAAVPWPSLDLQGSVTLGLPQPSFTFVPTGLNWRTLALLTIPLFQTGDEYARHRLAKIEALAAELRVGLLEKRAREEVARAIVQYGARTRSLAIAEQQVEQARENYTLVQRQFRAGTATSTDVVIAQATLDEAESQQAVAGFDRIQAAYEILYSAGML